MGIPLPYSIHFYLLNILRCVFTLVKNVNVSHSDVNNIVVICNVKRIIILYTTLVILDNACVTFE